MTPDTPALRLMRERVEIGVPVPTDIARCALDEVDQLRSSVAAVRSLAVAEIDNRGECDCCGAPDFGGGVYGSHEGDCVTNDPPMVHAHALLDALASGGSVPSSGGTT